MQTVKFKYPDQAQVYPKLLQAVTKFCNDKGKKVTCVSGYRSLQNQIETNQSVLISNPGSTQRADGSVYNKRGQCLAAAYGKSNHCFCLAMDIGDAWFETVSNAELAVYRLIKPMDYEPWHAELIETRGISQAKKEAIRDTCLKGWYKNMTLEEFQILLGLTADGINGPKTKEKAEEIMRVCREITGAVVYSTPEEVIWATQSNPDLWIKRLNEISYFGVFIMNIVKKIGGK